MPSPLGLASACSLGSAPACQVRHVNDIIMVVIASGTVVLLGTAVQSAVTTGFGPQSWPVLSVCIWLQYLLVKGWHNMDRSVKLQVRLPIALLVDFGPVRAGQRLDSRSFSRTSQSRCVSNSDAICSAWHGLTRCAYPKSQSQRYIVRMCWTQATSPFQQLERLTCWLQFGPVSSLLCPCSGGVPKPAHMLGAPECITTCREL